MKPHATADIAVVAAVDSKQLRGEVLSGPTPGRFYALVPAAALSKWRALNVEQQRSERGES